MNITNRYIIQYSLSGADLEAYVAALHELQDAAMEDALAVKQEQGFPEAMAIINRMQTLDGR